VNSEQKSNWIITVDEGESVQAVAEKLGNRGMAVSQILEFTNTVVASGDEAAAADARTVAGVVDVSPDHPMHASS
jgi:hypothetical protein